MTADAIARVVADLRAGRVRNAIPENPALHAAALEATREAVVVDATAIYRSLVAKDEPVYLYEDHPCIAPPWPAAAVCYENEHGNVLVMQANAKELPRRDRRALWDDPGQPVDWQRVRWLVDAFVWLGGRSPQLGGAFATAGPVHWWRFAVYDGGEPADLRWVRLIPDYPMERWDMAHLVLLGALNFMNCFAAETPVVTGEGVVPIGKLAGRAVEVLTRQPTVHAAARFARARIESFGRQPLVELEVRRNGTARTYRTTAGHRWFVRKRWADGCSRIAEVTTADLRPGDRLVTVRPRSRADASRLSGIGVAHGLVYGDGSRRPYPEGCVVDLFGEDRHALLRFFPEPVVADQADRACLHVSHLPRSFKDLPPEDEASPYLYSFLAGWFAADGDVGRNGSVRLSCAQPEPLEWVHRVALARLGIVTGLPRRTMRRGIDGTLAPLWSIRFDRGSLAPSFFVRERHRERYGQRAIKAEPNHWEVVAVRPTDTVEEVFCAVVPGTEAFVLDGMVLTGNCRNVELVEPARPRGERRRLERLGVRVHTINVLPVGRATRGTGGDGGGGGVPLTSVRGHFAHYGPQYGRGLLFGRYAGRFWIPQHARGSDEHGRSEADYRLVPEPKNRQ